MNGVGSLFFRDRSLRFGENMPQSLKRFMSNFNVVATPRQKKRPLISDHIKGPLVAAFRSPLIKALDRSVETLGL